MRRSPSARTRCMPPRRTTPGGQGTCPTSASRCGPGSSTPGSGRTWIRRSRASPGGWRHRRAGHPDRPDACPTSGHALQTRFERTGQLADLDQAITGSPRRSAPPRPTTPTGLSMLSNLGDALRTRFERTGQLADLDEAITCSPRRSTPPRRAIPTGPCTCPTSGYALQTRFERTGQLADLDQAIILLSEAVDATPAGHPDRPMYLSNLGDALRTRFERTGQQADLEQAIIRLSEAVEHDPGRPPQPARILSNLGNALRTGFGRTGQAVGPGSGHHPALRSGPGHPGGSPRPGRCTCPISGPRCGPGSANSGQLADLDRAITTLAEAVDAAPADHPDRPMYLSNLGTRCEPGSSAPGSRRTWTRRSRCSGRVQGC